MQTSLPARLASVVTLSLFLIASACARQTTKKPGSAAASGGKTPAKTPAKAGAADLDAKTKQDLDNLEKDEKELTNPVLAWKLATKKDPRTGGSSAHPTASTFLNDDGDQIDVTASCNQNGVSVFFVLDTLADLKAPSFEWHHDPNTTNGDPITDVHLNADGKQHVATGYPDDDQDKLYNNSAGVFFYAPSLAQTASAARQRQSATGTPLDGLLGPLVKQAADAEAEQAAADSAGPVTDLLNAHSIRAYLSIVNYDDRPYVELSPQDPVLHKFVADCAAHF